MKVRVLEIAPELVSTILKDGVSCAAPRYPVPDDLIVVGADFDTERRLVRLLVTSTLFEDWQGVSVWGAPCWAPLFERRQGRLCPAVSGPPDRADEPRKSL